MTEILVQQKSFNGNSNHLVGVIPACGQANDMFYAHHNSLLPIGNNITAIERCIYECMLVGCQSIWINCHPSIVNVLKLYFGNYFKNPNFIKLKKFTDFPIVPQYLPIYYMIPSPVDFNKRTSWTYSALYAAKNANYILNSLLESTKNVKFYFTFPICVYPLSDLRKVGALIKNEKNFCFSHHGKTFKDGIYAAFTLNKSQINDCLEKLPYLETEYTEFGFNSRFFPINKILKHVDLDKFSKIELDRYYPIYTNKKYFDYLKNGDYCEIKKRHALVKNYMNWKIIKKEE